MEHGGEDCYNECNGQEGKCDWCGPDGWCCRKNWAKNGCDGTIGGTTNHQCVLKPIGMVLFLRPFKYFKALVFFRSPKSRNQGEFT